jgi:hypothetical protein
MNTDKSREGTNQKAKKQKAESKKAESRKQKAERPITPCLFSVAS